MSGGVVAHLSARELLDGLEARGLRLWVEGEVVRYVPASLIGADELAELRERREELRPLVWARQESRARAALAAAGVVHRDGSGRVRTPRGPGRLLSLVTHAYAPGCGVVVLLDGADRAIELPASACEPEPDWSRCQR